MSRQTAAFQSSPGSSCSVPKAPAPLQHPSMGPGAPSIGEDAAAAPAWAGGDGLGGVSGPWGVRATTGLGRARRGSSPSPSSLPSLKDFVLKQVVF